MINTNLTVSQAFETTNLQLLVREVKKALMTYDIILQNYNNKKIRQIKLSACNKVKQKNAKLSLFKKLIDHIIIIFKVQCERNS